MLCQKNLNPLTHSWDQNKGVSQKNNTKISPKRESPNILVVRIPWMRYLSILNLLLLVRSQVHMDSGFNGIQIKDDPELLQEIEISVQFPYLKLETVK